MVLVGRGQPAASHQPWELAVSLRVDRATGGRSEGRSILTARLCEDGGYWSRSLPSTFRLFLAT